MNKWSEWPRHLGKSMLLEEAPGIKQKWALYAIRNCYSPVVAGVGPVVAGVGPVVAGVGPVKDI